MPILEFCINLAGATLLLLFAVRMVRSGIERSFGVGFQHILTRKNNPAYASLAGISLAIILQSSAAVTVLVAGFSANNFLNFNTGLIIVLGGDLGSALIIQLLSYQVNWLISLLLTIGGWMFIKKNYHMRQYGRIVLGIAFILISLRFLREAMEPIRDSNFLPIIVDYLEHDYLTAFLVGSTLAFIMHSSVATILMCVTLVSIEAIGLNAGISLVLGANLGSALIPLWLIRGMNKNAQRVPITNLVLRGSLAVIALFIINLTILSNMPIFIKYPAQTLITVHIVFNFILLILCLPLINSITQLSQFALPTDTTTPFEEQNNISALDKTAINNPTLALSNLKRELLRMSEMIHHATLPIMQVYQNGDINRIEHLIKRDQQINQTLATIRHYVAALPYSQMKKQDVKISREMMEYAINLETAGDIIAKQLLPLAREKAQKKLKFSKAGWNELLKMHEVVLANICLASNVLLSDDVESARLLVNRKSQVVAGARKSRKRHLKRLSKGAVISFESSDIHLETLHCLKDLNSQCAAIAYPLLYKSGQLLETRLIEAIDENNHNA